MDGLQDLLELDGEISRINNFRDSDPFLPVLPSLEISEEPSEDRLDTLQEKGLDLIQWQLTSTKMHKVC